MLINLELPERITEESHRLKTCEVKHWSSSNKSREGLSFYELIKRSCLYKSLHGWEDGITITPRQKCQASLVMQESCYVAMTRLVHFPNLRLYAIFLCTTKHYLGHGNTNVKCYRMRIVVVWAMGTNNPTSFTLSLSFLPVPPFFPHSSVFPLFHCFPLSYALCCLSLPVSVLWHTRHVHLFVESVVVMLCGSCWGQWPLGVLWCNDPCHRLSTPSGQLRREVDGR